MYLRTMKELYENYNCQYLALDIKKGSYENIVQSSTVFSIICKIGLDKYIIQKQNDSYEQKLHDGKSEQFQRLELYLPIIVRFIKLQNWFSQLFPHKKSNSWLEGPNFVDSNPHLVLVPKDNPMAQLRTALIHKSISLFVFSATIVLPLYFFSRSRSD